MQSVMDTRDSVDTERSGLTRRQIIQGAALSGAACWAVPVIDSVTNMAAAVGSGGVPYCYSSCIEQSNCGVNGFGGAMYVEPGRLPTTAHVSTARTSGCRATTALRSSLSLSHSHVLRLERDHNRGRLSVERDL